MCVQVSKYRGVCLCRGLFMVMDVHRGECRGWGVHVRTT